VPSSPEICVIVVAFRGDRWIARCVESLYASCGMAMGLLVIDNGETPSLRALADRFPAMKVLPAPRRMGFAEANNFALKSMGNASFICFLNQDTISQANWLERCIDAMKQQLKLAAVIPVTHNYTGIALDAAFVDCAGSIPTAPIVEVEFAPAAAMVVRADALKKTGGFDPIFGSYYEDYDLCRRFREAGYTIGVVRDAAVHHYGSSATTDVAAHARRGRLLVRNRAIHEIRMSGAHRTGAIARQLAIEFPRRFVRSLRGRSVHSPRQLLAGYLDLLPLIPRLATVERPVTA
jgi:GT2 family glycosyltransferase